MPRSGVADLDSRLGDQIQFDDPLSREVMGTVLWEDGRPAAEAEVFLQDAMNFRRFLQRVVTNRNGFFRIPNVPAGASYVAFALPSKDKLAMKSFVYPRVDPQQRETWFDFTLSPHRIVGQIAAGGSTRRVDLVREDPGGQKNIVWSVIPTAAGNFEITNVPHGRYVVQAVREEPLASIASIHFVVERDVTVEVRWPE